MIGWLLIHFQENLLLAWSNCNFVAPMHASNPCARGLLKSEQLKHASVAVGAAGLGGGRSLGGAGASTCLRWTPANANASSTGTIDTASLGPAIQHGHRFMRNCSSTPKNFSPDFPATVVDGKSAACLRHTHLLLALLAPSGHCP